MDYGQYKGGLLGMLGGDPGVGLAENIYSAWKKHKQQQMDQQLNAGMDRTAAESTAMPQPPMPQPPMQQQPSDESSDGFEPMSQGKIVTQPTRAIIGDKGPEMVVPLTAGTQQKVSPAVLGMKARYGGVGGPNSLKHVAPLNANLPIRPNRTVR